MHRPQMRQWANRFTSAVAHFILAAIPVIACAAVAGVTAEPPADVVLINGRIWTGDDANSSASALAVRGGRFVFVGSDLAARGHIGDKTRIIDAGGRRIVPGLIDTHIHLASAADDFQHLYLREARSREHLLEMIADHAQTLEPDDWLVGVRWTAESWPDQRSPDADEIDEAADGRRAVLIRMDGHMLLASRAALEYAKITGDGPPDPPGGRIGRGEGGVPDGALYEQAMGLTPWRTIARDEDEDEFRERFRRALAECNRVGLTQVGAIESRAVIEDVLVALDVAGELPLRVAATVRPGSDRLQRWADTLAWARDHAAPSRRVRVIGFKGMMDGTLGSRTAWQNEPYLDNPDAPSNAGFPLAFSASGGLEHFIVKGASLGLQPAVHAIGERANHVLLNWFEKIPEDQRKSLRPRIEHAQHLLPDDVARFGQLGVVASMQPLHKADDGRYAEQRLGLERLRTSYAFRDLIDSGAILAFGSDWPVVSVNPFAGIAASVTSKTIEGKVFLPHQAITVEEALHAYTRGGAKCLLSENETGMIRAGMHADFVMLDRDLLEVDFDDIADTKVVMTVVGGEVVYERQ